MTGESALRFAVIAFIVVAAATLFLGGTMDRRQALRTGLHGLVAILAAVAYLALTDGARVAHVGPIDVDTRSLLLFCAVPLILLALAATATPFGQSSRPLAATLAFVGMVMVLAGAIAVDASGATVWVWFLVWLIALGLVFYLLWVPLREFAESGHPMRRALFHRHAALLTALWSLWPLVFFLGPDFQNAFGPATRDILLTAIDLAALGGYGLLVVLEDDPLAALRGVEGVDAPITSAPPVRTTLPLPRDARGRTRDALLERAAMEAEAAEPERRRTGMSAPPRRTAPPRRPRKPLTPFGPLVAADAVPVALVAVTLFVIARLGARRD